MSVKPDQITEGKSRFYCHHPKCLTEKGNPRYFLKPHTYRFHIATVHPNYSTWVDLNTVKPSDETLQLDLKEMNLANFKQLYEEFVKNCEQNNLKEKLEDELNAVSRQYTALKKQMKKTRDAFDNLKSVIVKCEAKRTLNMVKKLSSDSNESFEEVEKKATKAKAYKDPSYDDYDEPKKANEEKVIVSKKGRGRPKKTEKPSNHPVVLPEADEATLQSGDSSSGGGITKQFCNAMLDDDSQSS
jgi:hypothetical protein